MKKEVVDLHFKLAEASLGVGGLFNLNKQINKYSIFWSKGPSPLWI